MNFDWDWATAEREFKRALELNPGYATAHQWYGEFLASMGRPDEGIAELKRARDLEKTLSDVQDRVRHAVHRHELPSTPVVVTLTGFDRKQRRELS